MKKSGQFFPLLAILMLLAACAGKSQASSSDAMQSDLEEPESTRTENEIFSYKTVSFTNPQNSSNVYYSLIIDIPTSNSPVSKAIYKWLLSELDTNSETELSESYLNSYVNQRAAELKSRPHEAYAFAYEDIGVALQTDKILSYESISEWPSFPAVIKGVTFDLKTLQPITWDIIPSSKQGQFNNIVINLLDKAGNDADMIRSTWGDIPSSEAAPIFTKDGIIYSYTDQMRDYKCIIPYEALNGIVTPEIKALFPTKADLDNLHKNVAATSAHNSPEQRKALIPARIKEFYSTWERDKFMTDEYKRIRSLAESHADGDVIIDADPWIGTNGDGLAEAEYTVGEIKMDGSDKAFVTIVENGYDWVDQYKLIRKRHICSSLELVWVNNNWYVNDVGGSLRDYKDFLKDIHVSY